MKLKTLSRICKYSFFILISVLTFSCQEELPTFVSYKPDQPWIYSPSNGSNNVPISTSLQWNKTKGADLYRVQLSLSKTFDTSVVDSSGIIATQLPVAGLKNDTMYFWRICASNDGGTSAFSVVDSFRTIMALPTLPVLISPATGGVDISSSPVFYWHAIPKVNFYGIQVSRNSSFSSIVYSNMVTGDTSYACGLSDSTQYFWRVFATNTAGTCTSKVQSFTTRPAILAGPGLVSPVNGAASQATACTLMWSSFSKAVSYIVEVSTSSSLYPYSIYKSGVKDTTLAISGLSSNTKYYWCVCAVYASGERGCSSIYSFTTALGIPDIPDAALAWPGNGATGVSTYPTFNWNSANGASSYTMQVATDTNFATLIFSKTGITTNSQLVTGLLNNTKYYWRVKSVNAAGESAFTKTICFATTLETPELVSPVNGKTNAEVSQTFSWNAVAGADSYTLQVSTSSYFFSYSLNRSGITENHLTFDSLSHKVTYYWRVHAVSSIGVSENSSIFNFTTIVGSPATPVLQSPADGAQYLSASPILQWGSVSEATSYALQVATDSTFTSIVVSKSNISADTTKISGLSGLTTYYWRVKAINAGGESDYSKISKFTTNIASPTLVSPDSGKSNASISQTLTWNPVSGADFYTLQVSTTNTFASFVLNRSGIQGTSVSIDALNYKTTYYWRVRSVNSNCTSEFSSIYCFTTIPVLPSAPVLFSPSDGAQAISTSPTLSWVASTDATSYTLQVSLDGAFSSLVYNTSGITPTTQTITGLNNSTIYYWRVSASNIVGSSGFSTIRQFTTTFTGPELLSPAFGATNQSNSPTLSWKAYTGATSYTVQVSTNNLFTSYVYNQSGITSTSQQLNSLLDNTIYYWRVSATTSAGTSSYSDVGSFYTAPTVPFVEITGGSFVMGDFTGQDSDALPTVSANVSTFMMSKREISQYTWFTVMGTNPSYYSGDMLPVDQVTWYDAIAFCNKLSSREGKTPCYSINGNTAPADWTSGTITMSKTGGYRLPTEAEWEYAAREQGKTIRYAGTDDSASVSSYAWTVENSGQTIHNTGTKSPNALGLYDMSGNVIEWCWNKYEAYTYTSVNYPSAPSSSYDSVVMRGGSFEGVVTDCKVTKRYAYNPLSTDSQRGFRIVQDWVWDF